MTPEQLEVLSDIDGFETSLFALVVELRTVLLIVRQHQCPLGKKNIPIPRQVSDEEQEPVSKETFELVRNCAKEYVLTKPGYSSVISRHYRALKAYNQVLARYEHIFKDIPEHALSPQQKRVKDTARHVFKTIHLGEHLYG